MHLGKICQLSPGQASLFVFDGRKYYKCRKMSFILYKVRQVIMEYEIASHPGPIQQADLSLEKASTTQYKHNTDALIERNLITKSKLLMANLLSPYTSGNTRFTNWRGANRNPFLLFIKSIDKKQSWAKFYFFFFLRQAFFIDKPSTFNILRTMDLDASNSSMLGIESNCPNIHIRYQHCKENWKNK